MLHRVLRTSSGSTQSVRHSYRVLAVVVRAHCQRTSKQAASKTQSHRPGQPPRVVYHVLVVANTNSVLLRNTLLPRASAQN